MKELERLIKSILKELERLMKSVKEIKTDTLLAFSNVISQISWLGLIIILGVLVWTLRPVLVEWFRVSLLG